MMRWGSLELRPSVVAAFCALFYFDPWGCFFPFVIGILLHEGAHLAALRLLRVEVSRVHFGLTGAILCTAPMGYRLEILCAAAGPLTNLLLFALFLHRAPVFAVVNLCLTVYNLLPFYPLDGGRILRAALHSLFSDRNAAITEQLICLLCLAALGVGSVLLTCVLHEGLWPILLFALLALKLGMVSDPLP